MSEPSSDDLHPRHGGRFVLSRHEHVEPPAYTVEVFLPKGITLHSTLTWTDAGPASLDPPLTDAWAQAEVLKLARVLRKNPRDRLSRWRQ
jgi:hypothetical protein